MQIKAHVLPVLLVLILLATGCSSPGIVRGSELLSVAPVRPAPTPTFWDFPRGRFSAIDAPNLVILVIENDASYRVYRDNSLLDSGKFEIMGAQVLVDSAACAKRGLRPATYVWGYDEEQVLGFQAVGADYCPERQQYLSTAYQPKYVFVFAVPNGAAPEPQS